MTKETARQVGLMAYILYGVGAIFPPAAIAGVIFAYYKRNDVAGTFASSHMTWLIRTFWLTVILGIVGYVLALILIGFLILFAVAVWYIYRVVKGFVVLADNKAIQSPDAMF